MQMTRRFNVPPDSLQKLASIVTIGYVIAIQIPLLSPYRLIPADEMLIVDASYGIASGRSWVPAGDFWSHTVPVSGVFFTYYSPLYHYLQAIAIAAVGLSPVGIGLLHCILRLGSVMLFWRLSQGGLGLGVRSLLTTVWATIAVAPPGRPEDLALFFSAVRGFLAGRAHELASPIPPSRVVRRAGIAHLPIASLRSFATRSDPACLRPGKGARLGVGAAVASQMSDGYHRCWGYLGYVALLDRALLG